MNGRKQRMAELDERRRELEARAAAIEQEARGLSEVTEGDRRYFLEAESRSLREQAREIGRQWADLAEEDLGDLGGS